MALSETDVAVAARDAVLAGSPDANALLSALGLHCEEACGYCLDHPEDFLSIASSEWETCLDDPPVID
jgi:hypothetical protein